jgi:hypothetical protein
MYIRYPKLTLFFANVFVIAILFGTIEIASWLYLKSLWGENIEKQIAQEYLDLKPDVIRKLYETENIEPIKKLLARGGAPFNEDFIHHIFFNRKHGMRRVKNQAPWPPEKNKINIFFFGGSTTLGYGVLFDQSIPSYTQELFYLKKKLNVSAYNFGQTSYASIHELSLFKDILLNGFIPKIAVFIDGLNDLYFAFLYDKTSSSFLKIFENLFKKTNFNKVVNIFFGAKSSNESIEKALGLLNTHRTIIKKEFCERFGIVCIFVHQPVPLYHYDIKKHLYINYKYKGKYKLAFGLGQNVSYGYELFNKKMTNNEFSKFKNQLLDLSKFEIDANLYIDAVHYSPKFNQAIAMEIINFMEKTKIFVRR